MALTTLAQIQAAPKQYVQFLGTMPLGVNYSTIFATAALPAGGVLAGGRTGAPVDDTVGSVPTQATPGYPAIAAFPAGATGYISGIRLSLAGTTSGLSTSFGFILCDRLFVAGPYNFNANAQLSGPPSFAARVPNNPETGTPDYRGIEAWTECVTASTGNLDVTIRYTNDAGVTGVQSNAQGVGGATAIRRCFQLPYGAGSKGIQALDRVNGGTATAGTFNVMILRRLVSVTINDLTKGDIVLGPHQTGCPIISRDAALYPLLAGGVFTGAFDAEIEIAMG